MHQASLLKSNIDSSEQVCVPVRVRECVVPSNGFTRQPHSVLQIAGLIFSVIAVGSHFIRVLSLCKFSPRLSTIAVEVLLHHEELPRIKKKVHACVTAIQRRVFVNVLINPSPDQRVQRSWVLLLRATVSTQSTPKACKHTRMNCTAAQRSSQRELYSVTSLMGQNFTT